ITATATASAAAIAAATTTIAATVTAVFAAVFALLAAAGTLADRVGLAEFLERGLAGELDAALVVDQEDLDLDLVAHLDDVIDALDVLVGELGDVAEAVGFGGDLDERAEILEADDLAGVDLADLHLGGHRLDDVAALLGGGGVHRRDVHCTVVLDIDVGA